MTTVTDADREAAADYFGMTNDALRADFARSGKYDLSVCVQAFARHREAEVAKIVAMLDREKAEAVEMKNHQAAFWFVQIKKAIEAGEYRNDA